MTQIKDIDKGWKKHGRMLKAQAHRDPHVIVGVTGDEAIAKHAEAGDLTVVDVARAHEFGEGRLPERSFIRANHDKHEAEYKALMRRMADKVIDGKVTQKQALGLVGQKVEKDMRALMRAGIEPPKADGEPARLKDTGQLYGSIASVVGDI